MTSGDLRLSQQALTTPVGPTPSHNDGRSVETAVPANACTSSHPQQLAKAEPSIDRFMDILVFFRQLDNSLYAIASKTADHSQGVSTQAFDMDAIKKGVQAGLEKHGMQAGGQQLKGVVGSHLKKVQKQIAETTEKVSAVAQEIIKNTQAYVDFLHDVFSDIYPDRDSFIKEIYQGETLNVFIDYLANRRAKDITDKLKSAKTDNARNKAKRLTIVSGEALENFKVFVADIERIATAKESRRALDFISRLKSSYPDLQEDQAQTSPPSAPQAS